MGFRGVWLTPGVAVNRRFPAGMHHNSQSIRSVLPEARRVAEIGRGAATQKTSFFEPHYTGDILISLSLTGCSRCIAVIQRRIAPTHSERQLFIFEGSRRMAAPGFRHRPLRALKRPTPFGIRRQKAAIEILVL
jgi:hypothetical protein